MPAPFSANSTLPIVVLLASEASRAVLASVLTPASICARSGATDIWASPLTEIVATGASSARAGTLRNPPASTTATRNVARSIRHCRDRIRNRDGTFCHVRMQSLHHPAVELNSTARGIFRPLERRDDFSRLLDFVGGRGADRVAGLDLAWVNQGLAVEAEIAALRAFLRESVDIAEIAVGSVKNFEAVQAGGQNAVRDHRQHRRAPGVPPGPG